INVEEAEAYRERAGAGLTVMGQAQAEHQQAAEPTAHFLRLLCSAISSGRAHVASTAGGEPERPAACGWRGHATARGETAYLGWKPQGRRVGWVTGGALYLDPDASFAEAQQLAVDQGESLPVTSRTLGKRLHERKLLKSTEEGRGKLRCRRTVEGKRV